MILGDIPRLLDLPYASADLIQSMEGIIRSVCLPSMMLQGVPAVLGYLMLQLC